MFDQFDLFFAIVAWHAEHLNVLRLRGPHFHSALSQDMWRVVIRSTFTVSASGTSPTLMCIQTVFVGAIFILYFRRVVTNLVTRSCATSGESAASTRSSAYSKCCRDRLVSGTPLLSPCGKSSSSTFCRNRLNRMGPSIEPWRTPRLHVMCCAVPCMVP